MTPEQVKACRAGLRLPQPKFAKELGISRMSVNHYEHGYRHDDRRPVEIPRAIELGCAALWLGVSSIEEVMPAGKDAGEQDAASSQKFPANAIKDWQNELAVCILAEQGIPLQKDTFLAFPLIRLMKLWNDIEKWCAEANCEIKLRTVADARIPWIGIIEFENKKDPLNFYLRWVGE